MKVIIVSGGASPSKKLLNEELQEDSYLICADSGANFLYSYNMVPNYLIGDFDSIDTNILKHYKSSQCEIEQYPKDKDFTDTELALNKAIELGASEIVFLGCTGSRLDHTLGNIGLLLKCLEKNIDSCILDDNNKISMLKQSVTIFGKAYDNFSLLAYKEAVNNLSIHGAKYELQNYNLQIGDPLTLSNEFLEESVDITFDSGILLIMRCRD